MSDLIDLTVRVGLDWPYGRIQPDERFLIEDREDREGRIFRVVEADDPDDQGVQHLRVVELERAE